MKKGKNKEKKSKKKELKPLAVEETLNPNNNLSDKAAILYWVTLICFTSAAGLFFYTRFSEVNKLMDKAEDILHTEMSVYDDTERVLGVFSEVDLGSDSTGSSREDQDSSESSDTDESENQVVAEADDNSDEVDSVVDDVEEERRQKIRDLLKLQLPEETDNPNYAITFVEPTEDGVEIQVDGEGMSKKKSPFILPSLSIGKHTINFKFKDEEEVTQYLEETIIVIPRPPAFSDEQKKDFKSNEEVELSGTALPNSKVVLMVSSDVITTVIDVDKDGNWETVIDDEVSSGDHSAVALVRKDGYASNFSDVFEFSVGKKSGGDSDSDGNDEGFSIQNIITEDNIYLVLAGFAVLAGLLLVLIGRMTVSVFKKRDSGEISEKLFKKSEELMEKKNNGQTPSLREKFASLGVGVGDKKVESSKDSGKKKEKSKKKDSKRDEKEKSECVNPEDSGSDAEKSKTKNDKEKNTSKGDEKSPKEKSGDDKKDQSENTKEKDRSDKDEGNDKPEKGKVYSKEQFLKKFKEEGDKDTNNIKITLTSGK
ncbi:hypothetical protein JW710_01955 [Candidatus Dojkabacteria bacterium]|nr:hypothetical protein [Candidatus Dojkabacteria bacterium]